MLDSSILLIAGIIFIWNNYPFYDFEDKDRRWFIFLGSCSIEELIFQVTTTTKKEYYCPGGKRQNNNFFELKSGNGGLEKDCIIDLTHYFEQRKHDVINSHKHNIVLKSKLSQDKVDVLVKHIKADKNIIGYTKKTIYQCLRNSGFRVSV